MRLYAFHGGGEMTPNAGIAAFAADPGRIVYLPYFFYLIEHPEGRVLFDTGTNPKMIEDIVGHMGPAGEGVDLRMSPGDDVVGRLVTIGRGTKDITHIVQSHLHYDHAGGLAFFPGVPVYVQEKELAYAFDPPFHQKDIYIRADFDHDVEWKPLNGEHDLFADGRVQIVPTPGHTAGHQSVVVQLASRTVVLCADAAYTPEILERRLLPALLSDPDDCIATYGKLRELETEHSAELIMAHDLDFATRTKVAPDAWYE